MPYGAAQYAMPQQYAGAPVTYAAAPQAAAPTTTFAQPTYVDTAQQYKVYYENNQQPMAYAAAPATQVEPAPQYYTAGAPATTYAAPTTSYATTAQPYVD